MVQEKLVDAFPERRELDSKKVVYLVGGGLTAATAARAAATGRLSMQELTRKAVAAAGKIEEFGIDDTTGPFINELLSKSETIYLNLEELIDLLDASGVELCMRLARFLSKEFGSALSDDSDKLLRDLPENLAEIVLDLHNIPNTPEQLVGIITTNYDTLLEVAFKSLNMPTDLGFEHLPAPPASTPLLKLHGSLDWLNSVPIGVGDFRQFNATTSPSWIGPRRSKVASVYPFNLIWGKAREVLAKADIVRVLGASLRASDWHIAQLLFQSTCIDANKLTVRIEVIDFVTECERIAIDHPVLRTQLFHQLEETIRNIRAGDRATAWSDDIGDDDRARARAYLANIRNPIDYWLQSKVQYLLNNKQDLTTPTGKLSAYALNTQGV